jgi:two-component system response regulator
LVEDNADDVELTRHGLNSLKISYDINVVANGEQALTYLDCDGNEKSEKPDLILLDIGLPGISGLEVLKRVRSTESCRRIPIVILSASEEEDDIARGYDLGANSYLCKPLNYSAFASVMKQLGLYWLQTNTPSPR